jgi:hypothetical protein
MPNDQLSLDELIALRRKKYELTKNIYCPFLKEVVYFNNKGFHHATHDGRGRIRNPQDARMRLNLLPCINDVIARSSHFGSPPRVKAKGHPENKTGKEIVEYEVALRFNQHKEVSVILRRVGNGRLHYFSVRYTKKQNRP